jgi:hypothetical protein
VAVIWLAREQYGFVPWVVLFLGLTWISTLYFGRRVAPPTRDELTLPRARDEVASYATRAMYQETLFFLLPFYAYSTVIDAPNVVFMVLLGVLAVLSCLDLMFDRWLRTSRVVSMLFFAVVAFAAVNLLIPVLLPMDPTRASQIAAGVAIASALPLALQGERPSRKEGSLLTIAAAAFVVVVLAFPRLVPPVPLRLQDAAFAASIDRQTLELPDPFRATVPTAALADGLYIRMQVFAPTIVPARVNLRWERDGIPLRDSRTIEITAHELGFRIWDVWRPEAGPVPAGRYEVILETGARRVFGSAVIAVLPSE